MSALTAARNTKEALGTVHRYPLAAGVIAFAGGLAVIDAAGNCKPGVTALGLRAVGRFEQDVDNSLGIAGALSVDVKSGDFRFANSSGGDEITAADIGNNAYIVDDQTVAKTTGGATRSIAGRIVDVDSLGVWVELGMSVTQAPGGAVLAANNGSDFGSLPTLRSNVGVAEKLGDPTITVGAEAVNVINVGVQLKDSAGVNLAVRGAIRAYLSDDANGDSIAVTAPSGGVAIGAYGVLIPQVAGKAFDLVSEADGTINIDITEAGADTWYLILILPDGRLVASGAITFA